MKLYTDANLKAGKVTLVKLIFIIEQQNFHVKKYFIELIYINNLYYFFLRRKTFYFLDPSEI